jgi:multidrug resistance efflux pump
MQRVKTATDKMIASAKNSVRHIDSALTEANAAEASAKQTLDYTEAAIQKAKELGVDSFVSKGEKSKKDIQMLISNYQKAVSELKTIKSILKY